MGARTRTALIRHCERIQDALNIIDFDDAPDDQKLARIRRVFTEGVTP